jgi:hypothetical protein
MTSSPLTNTKGFAMNIQNHLLSAAAAAVMTVATFGGIGGYADHIASASHVAAPVQTVAAASIDSQLQRTLRNAQRDVRNNVIDNVAALLPPLAIDLPTVTVIGRRI